MKVLKRFSDSISAHMAHSELRSHGIETVLFETTPIYGTLTQDVRLMVQEADRVHALELLQSREETSVLAEEEATVQFHGALEHEVEGSSALSGFLRNDVRSVVMWGGLVLLMMAKLGMLWQLSIWLMSKVVG